MQIQKQNEKFAISFGVIAVIAIASAAITIQTYFPDQARTAEPATGTPVRGGSGDYTPESSVTNSMPVPGTNTPEMVVSPQPPQKAN